MFCSRRRSVLFVVAALLPFLVFKPASAAAANWTFCVAEAGGGSDIYISEVFPAPRDRERLEGEFKSFLKGQGVGGAVVQCPAANDDKTEVVNAQFTAAEFHRKLGDILHEVSLAEFSPRR